VTSNKSRLAFGSQGFGQSIPSSSGLFGWSHLAKTCRWFTEMIQRYRSSLHPVVVENRLHWVLKPLNHAVGCRQSIKRGIALIWWKAYFFPATACSRPDLQTKLSKSPGLHWTSAIGGRLVDPTPNHRDSGFSVMSCKLKIAYVEVEFVGDLVGLKERFG